MSASAHMIELSEGLEKLGYVKVVKTEETDTQLRLLCRVTNKKAWCVVLERVMKSPKKNWTEHICQQYFIKGDSLVYGWNIIINSDDPTSAAKAICVLLNVPENTGVDEFPLRGALRQTGGAFDPRAPGVGRGGPSQKGAFSIGGK